jgi:hypothetical protein
MLADGAKKCVLPRIADRLRRLRNEFGSAAGS